MSSAVPEARGTAHGTNTLWYCESEKMPTTWSTQRQTTKHATKSRRDDLEQGTEHRQDHQKCIQYSKAELGIVYIGTKA